MNGFPTFDLLVPAQPVAGASFVVGLAIFIRFFRARYQATRSIDRAWLMTLIALTLVSAIFVAEKHGLEVSAVCAALLMAAALIAASTFTQSPDYWTPGWVRGSPEPGVHSCASQLVDLGRMLTNNSAFDVTAEFPRALAEAGGFDGVAAYYRDASGQLIFVGGFSKYESPVSISDEDYLVVNSGEGRQWAMPPRFSRVSSITVWHEQWRHIFPSCDEQGSVQAIILTGAKTSALELSEIEVIAIDGLVSKLRMVMSARQKLDVAQQQDNLAYIGKIAAGVAHDIRFPVSALRTFVENCDRGLPADLREELRQVALKECETITNTIDGITSLSRGQAFELRKFDLADLVLEVIHKHSSYAQDNKAQVTVNLPHGEHFVLAARDQFETAVGNLLRNSIEEIGSSGVEGAVSFGISSLREGFVTLRVSDTGGGLPSDVQEALFHDVVGCTTKPATEQGRSTGYGLGLFRARQIITTGHGGAFGYARNSFFLSLKQAD